MGIIDASLTKHVVADNLATFHRSPTMARTNETEVDDFARAYIEAALWSSTDDDGEPLDGLYTIDDLAPETLAAMVSDCDDFRASFGDLIPEDRLEGAAHDFWLTRCGHGAGFWDGGWSGPMPEGHEASGRYESVGAFLTAMSRPYGESTLYVGDDGLIHGS